MTKPTLVILAAGMGSRYGGLKQLEAIGPGGATLMDYSVYDALRAGFGKLVFVIRPEMEDAMRATLGRRYEQHIPVEYAFQRLEAVPDGFAVPPDRTKPWGTGQATLAAGVLIGEPFAVINADDFYGANSFATLSAFLCETAEGGTPAYAVVGYALRDTLTDAGGVNRAICHCTSDGWLEDIVETLGIERDGTNGRYTDEQGVSHVLDGAERVSMNMWGFHPAVLEQLREEFQRFLNEHAASRDAEFHLPSGIQSLVRAGRARVRVLPTADKWCGVTHPEDKDPVSQMIGKLVAAGRYPRKLWD